jgi:hypothetical protein
MPYPIARQFRCPCLRRDLEDEFPGQPEIEASEKVL